MGELADLIVALATLLGSVVSAFVLIKNARTPKDTVRRAAVDAAEKTLEAVADGELSPEEIEEIKQALHDRNEP